MWRWRQRSDMDNQGRVSRCQHRPTHDKNIRATIECREMRSEAMRKGVSFDGNGS